MEYRALYFLSYAAIATLGGIIAVVAMYNRQKNEGVPMNFTILKFIFGFAAAMWVGVAFANAAYSLTPTTAAVFAFAIGIIFSIFFAWQINALIRKMNTDAKIIKELSTSCSLTDLWNRRIFQERLSLEFARSKRHNHPLSLLLLDVETLGEINSTHGYASGDTVLLGLAKLLTSATRNVDLVCRYTSNLITIVLPDTKIDDAESFAQRLKDKIADHPFDISGDEPLHITVSIGVSAYSEDTATDSAVVDAAHDALRGARKLGQNHVYVQKHAAKIVEQKTDTIDLNVIAEATA